MYLSPEGRMDLDIKTAVGIFNVNSSYCGRSKWRGLAVKACFAKQPRDSSNSGWVTLSRVSSTGLGGCCFETFDCSKSMRPR